MGITRSFKSSTWSVMKVLRSRLSIAKADSIIIFISGLWCLASWAQYLFKPHAGSLLAGQFPCSYFDWKVGFTLSCFLGKRNDSSRIVDSQLHKHPHHFPIHWEGNFVSLPLLYNAHTKVSTSLFPKSEWSIVTNIGSSSINYGIVICYDLPSLFIDNCNSSQSSI